MKSNEIVRMAVIGTAGVPSSYGGFETLVENLCRFHDGNAIPVDLTIYCSEKHYKNKKIPTYLKAKLEYVNLNANGVSSIPYDLVSTFRALRAGTDVILVLGVSGAIIFPLLRLICRKALIVNIDGVEWKRQKWGKFAKWFLNLSERFATKYAHVTICDNDAISDYVRETYGVNPRTITYGGDHALKAGIKEFGQFKLPEKFAFSVCRIEPENNIHVILDAFSKSPEFPIIFVGNWNHSEYARNLRQMYSGIDHMYLLDPIYDAAVLADLRSKCTFYVHGHSAGGTNPSLVEAMFFGRPVLAFDCSYNRVTTINQAIFFRDASHLDELIRSFHSLENLEEIGLKIKEVAYEKYMWKDIAASYFDTVRFAYESSKNSNVVELKGEFQEINKETSF